MKVRVVSGGTTYDAHPKNVICAFDYDNLDYPFYYISVGDPGFRIDMTVEDVEILKEAIDDYNKHKDVVCMLESLAGEFLETIKDDERYDELFVEVVNKVMERDGLSTRYYKVNG